MICPLNTPEFRAAAAKLGGEDAAKRVYALFGSYDPFVRSESALEEKIDRLQPLVQSNPDYYLKVYSEYLTPILKGRQDADSIVAALAAYPKDILPPSDVLYYGAAASKPTQLHSVLQALSDRFNIPYSVYYDASDKRKGYYGYEGTQRMVSVNLAYATPDTPFHEYLHPFVQVLKEDNAQFYNYLLEKTNSITDEDLVEALGKEAVKRSSLFQQFLTWLRNAFKSLFGKNAASITELTTLGDLFSYLQNKSIDVSRESTLFTANQAAEVYKNAQATNIKDRFTFTEDIVEALKLQQGSFTTKDDSLYYQDASGADVATRATAFVGDKQVGVFSTKYRDKPEKMSTFKAEMTFKDNGIAFDDKIKMSSGELFTLQELADYYEKIADEDRLKGKIGHAYIEYRLQQDPALKQAAYTEATRYAEKVYPNVPLEATPVVSSLESDMQLLLNISGINYSVDDTKRDQEPDRIASEVVLKSDLLVDQQGMPLATTADGVIQTKHGQVKLVDWKFGQLTSDMDTSFFMAYGGSKLNIKDSKLDRAKLELVIRAVILKEKYPSLPFEFIRLIQVGKDGYYNTFDVDMQPYLDLLGNFYKKENPTVYKTLQDKGLLDEKNYLGVRPLTVRYIHELDRLPSFAEKLQWIENQLNGLTLYGDIEVESTERKRQRAALTQLYQELTALPGTNLEKNVDDIPKVVGQLKNLSDVNHPMVQTLHTELLKRKDAKNKEFEKYASTATKLLSKVLIEQEGDLRKRKLIRSILSAASVFGIVSLNPILTFAPLAANIILRRTQTKRSDAFAFMWKPSADASNKGLYLNTDNFYYDKEGRQIPLTAAQKEYRDYVASTMYTLYKEVMNAPAFVTDRGKVLTKAELMRRPMVLPDGFAPRYPKSIDEAREEQPFTSGVFGIGPRAKDFVKRNFTSLIEEEFFNNNGKGGLPLKYFSHFNSKIIEEGQHTLDFQQAYHAFMDSLLEKKYMDGMYSMAEGLKNTFEISKDEKGRQKYPELAKWMQSIITTQILKTNDGMGLTSSPWKIPLSPKVKKLLGLPENKEVIVAQDKFLMLLKSGVSFAGMGFRLMGATFNAALITITNTMEISKPLISKLMGVPPENIKSSERGVASAFGEYIKHIAKVMTGQGHTSKLWLMAKKFDWMPDNYDYKIGRDDLLADVTSPSLFSHAYMFHNIGETYGALLHLAAVTKAVKLSDGTKTFSIWDAYEVKDGELVWNKGSRGVTEISAGVTQELTELDTREIKNLKRVYERIQGSYRSEERAAIEATVVGQFLFQFKKFFFTYMKNLYASPFTDITVGNYVQNKSISRPDNMPVWQWEEEIMTGRLRVLTAAVAATVKLPWGSEQLKELVGTKGELTKHQAARRKALAELANTGMWLFFMMMILGASFDDDDKSYAKRRFTRLLQDASSGLLPVDLFDTIQKPVVAADRIAKTGKAFVQWAANEHTASGKRKGERDLLTSIPPFSGLIQIENMFEHTQIEQGPLFGIFPVTEGTSR